MANKRLIDKDALIELCDEPHWCVWMSEIEDFPTVDAVEVVHARWVHDGRRIHNGIDWWHCSECNKTETGVGIKSNYCPNCGAKMDGGNEK